MNKKRTQLAVRLIVWRFSCDPAEISEILKLVPDSTAIKGVPSAPGRPPAGVNNWCLASDVHPAEPSLASHVRSLIAKVDKCVANFAYLPKDAEVCLRSGVCDYGHRAELFLGPPELRWLVDIGASLDVDYYVFTRSDGG